MPLLPRGHYGSDVSDVFITLISSFTVVVQFFGGMVDPVGTSSVAITDYSQLQAIISLANYG